MFSKQRRKNHKHGRRSSWCEPRLQMFRHLEQIVSFLYACAQWIITQIWDHNDCGFHTCLLEANSFVNVFPVVFIFEHRHESKTPSSVVISRLTHEPWKFISKNFYNEKQIWTLTKLLKKRCLKRDTNALQNAGSRPCWKFFWGDFSLTFFYLPSITNVKRLIQFVWIFNVTGNLLFTVYRNVYLHHIPQSILWYRSLQLFLFHHAGSVHFLWLSGSFASVARSRLGSVSVGGIQIYWFCFNKH